MAGRLLDEVSLLNQRWGRHGTRLLVLSATGTILAHLLVTDIYSQSVFGRLGKKTGRYLTPLPTWEESNF